MFKLSTLVLAILLPLSFAAAQSTPRTFTVDGDTVVYTSRIDGDGILHLEGRSAKGEGFHLRLTRAGRLEGEVADRPVDVRVPRSQADRAFRGATAELASASDGR